MEERYLASRKWLFVTGALLILCLFIGLCSIRIKTVAVSGTNHYTAEQIEDAVFERGIDRISLYCYLKHHFKKHVKIPYVEDYVIKFRTPFKVQIIVYEKSMVGYVSYMNSMMYFDKDGMVVESTNEKLPEIPEVVGLDYGHIVLNRVLPVQDMDVFDELLNLTQMLSTSEIVADKIQFDRQKNATVYIKDLVVELGNNKNMSGKLTELKDILKDYQELSGILYLDDYDDNNLNPMYRFERRKGTAQQSQ